VLCCVIRTGQRYGTGMISDVLRAKQRKDNHFAQLGLDQQSTYGIMKGSTAANVRRIIDALLIGGYLESDGGEYPVLTVTERADELLRRGGRLTVKAAPVRIRRRKKRGAEAAAQTDGSLYEKLRRLRSELAARDHVPPYMVFPDATLRDMCEKHPRTLTEFLDVAGVGQKRLQRYGRAFLDVLNAHE